MSTAASPVAADPAGYDPACISPLPALMRQRLLILDGAMGTMIQRYPLEEEDFRGARFADHRARCAATTTC